MPFLDPVKENSCIRLLDQRLARAGIVNFNLMSSSKFQMPRDLNAHLGRFVGRFINTGPHLGFQLLGRKEPSGAITHVFALHVNSSFRAFPRTEKDFLKTRLGWMPIPSVTNVHAEMAPSQHHGALVERMELLLRLRLFVEPKENHSGGKVLINSGRHMPPVSARLHRDSARL